MCSPGTRSKALDRTYLIYPAVHQTDVAKGGGCKGAARGADQRFVPFKPLDEARTLNPQMDDTPFVSARGREPLAQAD